MRESDRPIIRPAEASDFCGIARLWREAFGDGEGFVRDFLNYFSEQSFAAVAELDGQAVSMGFLLWGPTAKEYSCGYIYAMATAPHCRGLGLATRIAERLKAHADLRCLDIVATLPAEESLNAWYAGRLQMVPVFKKGGPGVLFPPLWHSFSALCGEHDPDTPDRLLACARNPHILQEVMDLGWECTFD